MSGFWLLKSEESCFSIDDLAKDSKTMWDGVRNYQARNFMRDKMSVGDKVLYYHSNSNPMGVVGLAEVCSEPYPDFTAQDPTNDHYDPTATKEKPIWMMVDVAFVEKFPRVVTLQEMKQREDLDGMMVAQKGARLSVQPVSPEHFEIVCALARTGE